MKKPYCCNLRSAEGMPELGMSLQIFFTYVH